MDITELLDALLFKLKEGDLAQYITGGRIVSAQTLRNGTERLLNEQVLERAQGACIIICLQKKPKDYTLIETYQNYPVFYQIPGVRVQTRTT